MQLCDLDYDLPADRIAQEPLVQRDSARLLVLHRRTGYLEDRSVADLPTLLRPGDLLVLNDTRVVPARFVARRSTGGRVHGLFVREDPVGSWLVLLDHSGRLKPGEILTLVGSVRTGSNGGTDPPVRFTLSESLGGGHWRLAVNPQRPAAELLDRFGFTPLPPYIRRPHDNTSADPIDRAAYQTVYARTAGSVAAPTAGLHFTSELLERLRRAEIHTAFVTLHVGLGTFTPIRAERLAEHAMHAEWYELPPQAAEVVNHCRQRGGRVVAVGTTSVRVLEAAAASAASGVPLAASRGFTDIFIYPPYRFRAVDLVLSNFHLPRSSLLALVMAFAGREPVLNAYTHAIRQRYRFYSFGDAMLIV